MRWRSCSVFGHSTWAFSTREFTSLPVLCMAGMSTCPVTTTRSECSNNSCSGTRSQLNMLWQHALRAWWRASHCAHASAHGAGAILSRVQAARRWLHALGSSFRGPGWCKAQATSQSPSRSQALDTRPPHGREGERKVEPNESCKSQSKRAEVQRQEMRRKRQGSEAERWTEALKARRRMLLKRSRLGQAKADLACRSRVELMHVPTIVPFWLVNKQRC